MVSSARRLARPFAQFLRLKTSHSRNGHARTRSQGVSGSPRRTRPPADSGHGGGERQPRSGLAPSSSGRNRRAPGQHASRAGGRRAAGDRLDNRRKDGVADHRRERALRPVDRSSRRRRDGRWPRRIGRGDHRRRVGACLRRAARPRDCRDLGFALGARLLHGGARRTHLQSAACTSQPKPWTRGSRAGASTSD